MTVIDDVISHFESNWGSVTPKPSFFNGHKQRVEGHTNYMYVYLLASDYEDAESSGTYRNENHRLRLRIGSVTSQQYKDNMLAEVERLCAEIVSGYKYNRSIRTIDLSTTKEWKADVIFELKKFMVEK